MCAINVWMVSLWCDVAVYWFCYGSVHCWCTHIHTHPPSKQTKHRSSWIKKSHVFFRNWFSNPFVFVLVLYIFYELLICVGVFFYLMCIGDVYIVSIILLLLGYHAGRGFAIFNAIVLVCFIAFFVHCVYDLACICFIILMWFSIFLPCVCNQFVNGFPLMWCWCVLILLWFLFIADVCVWVYVYWFYIGVAYVVL